MKTLLLFLSGLLFVSFSVAAPSKAEEQTHYKSFKTPTTIQGITVIGEVEYYKSDTMEFARLAHDDTVFGQWFLAGTGIHMTKDGRIDWCFLPKDCKIQGHTFSGGGHEWMTEFYPSGKLKSGGLAEEELIDGIPCAPGTFWNEVFGGGGRTYFYESGKLMYAKVAHEVTYQGHLIEKGKHIKLKEDGSFELVK